jgi:hypothetical protein
MLGSAASHEQGRTREGEHMSAAGRNRRGNRTLKCLLATAGAAMLAAGTLASPAGAVTTTFSNPTLIAIPNSGTFPALANPYPSSIEVSGLQGNLVRVGVTLLDFSYPTGFPHDADLALVAPGGESFTIMSDVGSNAAVNSLTLDLQDGAPPLPTFPDPLTSGTFRFTDHQASDTFPPPGPADPRSPGGSSLGATSAEVFGGTNPNGVWHLYVVDDFPSSDTGSIADGWQLHVTTPNTPETTITQAPKDKTKKGRATFGFTASAAPTRHNENESFQCKLDNGPFQPCTSPTTYRVKKGKHTFQVQATIDGVTDSTPATDTWKRQKKKKK